VEQDQAGGGDVEGQAEQGRHQEDRWKDREIECLRCIERDQQDRQGDGDVGGQEDVQQERRQWNNHQCQNADQRHRHDNVGVFPERLAV